MKIWLLSHMRISDSEVMNQFNWKVEWICLTCVIVAYIGAMQIFTCTALCVYYGYCCPFITFAYLLPRLWTCQNFNIILWSSSFHPLSLLQGSMKTVVDCLLALKAQFKSSGCNMSTISTTTKPGSIHGDASSRGPLTPLSGEERRKASSESKFQCALHTPLMSGIALSLSLHKHVSMPPCVCLSMLHLW